MRIVIDTHVLVSSFFGGNPGAVVRLWRNGHLMLCLSQPIVEEYGEVLGRLGVDPGDIAELLGLLARGHHCLFACRAPDLRVVAEDPDDDRFIECAVALGATHIVTGDKALLAVGRYFDVAILTPRQLVDLPEVRGWLELPDLLQMGAAPCGARARRRSRSTRTSAAPAPSQGTDPILSPEDPKRRRPATASLPNAAFGRPRVILAPKPAVPGTRTPGRPGGPGPFINRNRPGVGT